MRKKLVSAIAVGLIAVTLLSIYLMPSQSVVPGPGEPQSLRDIVEYPEPVTLTDVEEGEKDPILEDIMGNVEGFSNIFGLIQGKGYAFDVTTANLFFVGGQNAGWFLSWWSDISANGTRALIVAALMNDGSSIAMGVITNLLPPELVPGIDPYIIVNAQPYIFISWYWWVPAPVARIHSWYYWWYDSHSHPNWYWGVYWWWRTDVEYYWILPYAKNYLPWWWLYWHWLYWRHWYWWSTYFPY